MGSMSHEEHVQKLPDCVPFIDSRTTIYIDYDVMRLTPWNLRGRDSRLSGTDNLHLESADPFDICRSNRVVLAQGPSFGTPLTRCYDLRWGGQVTRN
jgi:hypothetical protein